jgi:hypothetical protein
MEEEIQGIMAAELTLPEKSKILTKIRKHIVNGDLRKAREVLKKGGVRDITDPAVVARLREKYPCEDEEWRARHREHEESELRIAEGNKLCPNGMSVLNDDTDSLQKYIFKKKRGASRGANGQSNDDFQDMLKQFPDSITDLLIVANRIAAGCVVGRNTRVELTRCKGTALAKKAFDIRPIGSQNTILNYTGYLCVQTYEKKIKEICGPHQLMMAPGGVEVNGHSVAYLLKRFLGYVCGVFDVLNAFHAIAHSGTLTVLENKMPALVPFFKTTIDSGPTDVIFHDRGKKATVKVEMEKGVPQGGTISMALFCLSLSDITDILLSEFEGRVHFFIVGDGIHAVGLPEDVIASYERVGKIVFDMMGATVQMGKSSLYGMGEYSDAQYKMAENVIDVHAVGDTAKRFKMVDGVEKEVKGLEWIPSKEGFICAGTPIGSDDFRIEHVNNVVDGICAEIDSLAGLISTNSGGIGNTVQMIYHVIRLCETQQLCFLLRVCPPSITRHAAERLDIALANVVFHITDCVSMLPPERSDGDMPSATIPRHTPRGGWNAERR